MKKTIWKFEMEATNSQTIEMPIGAEILCVQSLYLSTCIWALVDSSAKTEKRSFEIFGTGQVIDIGNKPDKKYLGTSIINDDTVLHVFELI